jgi:hypothetical protein
MVDADHFCRFVVSADHRQAIAADLSVGIDG